jgi:protein phosphatase
VLNLPDRLCQDRNRERTDRNFGPHVIRQQSTTAALHSQSQTRRFPAHSRILNSGRNGQRRHRATTTLEQSQI